MITSETEITTRNVPPPRTEDETNHLPQQLVLTSKFTTHHPKAGINPIVDAAACLFSMLGKLKQLKACANLAKLQQDILQELDRFQDIIKAKGHPSETILVCRYALCVSFDDVISHMSWGTQGQWESFNLLATLNQEPHQQDRFFAILERIVKDPATYIDLMELMYLCLSSGYKGSYRSSDFNQVQLEQITNALYKRIRAFRGDFSKKLSPFSITPLSTKNKITFRKKHPTWLIVVVTLSIIMSLFIGLGFLLQKISNQAFYELTHIGKFSHHDTTHS